MSPIVALPRFAGAVSLRLMARRFPEFEPEVLAAAARAGGEAGRLATTTIDEAVVCGVRLTSRWRQARELNLMARVVEDLPAHWLMVVDAVFCDSQTGAHAIKVRPCRQKDMQCLAELFEELFLQHAGGHEGINLWHGPHAAVFLYPRKSQG